MSDPWEALDRNSIRAAEAKFGVRHPRHDEAALDDLCPNSGATKGVCGCVSCSDTTASERRILLDLIAELRRTTKGYLSPRAYAITVEQQREMADAAEAQLREAMRNDE